MRERAKDGDRCDLRGSRPARQAQREPSTGRGRERGDVGDVRLRRGAGAGSGDFGIAIGGEGRGTERPAQRPRGGAGQTAGV